MRLSLAGFELRFSARLLMTAILLVAAKVAVPAQPGESLRAEIARSFGGRQGAAVVIRVRDSQILAAHNPTTLAMRVATPGSTIKPFVLQLLLEKKLLHPEEMLICRQKLQVAGKRLGCSHAAGVMTFNGADALAASCNSYFVSASARLNNGDLERRFHELGFTRPSGLMGNEGEGRVVPSRTLADRQLLAIGAAGIRVTPMELASAYLGLASLDRRRVSAGDQAVLLGLERSTEYGLAFQVRPTNISVAGKTGTASDSHASVTHAWFAGFAPVDRPEIVVVVFVEQGRGSNEAATIARAIFEAYSKQR